MFSVLFSFFNLFFWNVLKSSSSETSETLKCILLQKNNTVRDKNQLTIKNMTNQLKVINLSLNRKLPFVVNPFFKEKKQFQ